jgi:hypothetical protein
MHSMRTDSRAGGKISKFHGSLRIVFGLPFDFTAELCHRSSVSILLAVSIARWFAPQARAESRFFRDRWLPKKCHLLASRAA